MKNHVEQKLDFWGIGVGIACAIHCAVFPIIFAGGLFAGVAWLDHMYLDLIFLAISIYLGFNSLIKSYLNLHKNLLPIGVAFLGMTIISYVLLAHLCDYIVLPALGGILLAVAHFLNFRLVSNFKQTT